MTQAVDEITYADLYSRWERGNWRATEIDFSVDREHWHERLDETQRRAALWNYSLFFHGEHAVASTLSPYVDAAPTAEQAYFLTTQQVDEARHAVFFARFMQEVVEAGGSSVESTLAATHGELTWGFRNLFARLDRMADELKRDPSRRRLAAALTLYHVVIEGTLAQPGQHFIETYLEENDLLPGFREGMGNVSRDEQRHIAFGVKLLGELCRDDPRCRDSVIDLLREIVPWALGVFVPPGFDRSYTECFGFSLEDIYEHATRSFEARLRAAGLPPEELHGAVPINMAIAPRERAERAIALLEAGILGEPNGAPRRDLETVDVLFDSIADGLDDRHAPPGGMTIEWDLTDLGRWHVVVDNGSTRAARGPAPGADVTLSCAYADWVDLFAARESPARALVRRKVRPRGSPRSLIRLSKLLGG